MSSSYFITGISTDVGKTVVSAVLVEALKADYWKPIQAGDLEFSDTDKVKNLVSNTISVFHNNAYALNTPMSPHAAAEIDNLKIDLNKINVPKTNNNLIIEGAGGLLVPLNNKDTILDIIPKKAKVVLVVKHYLGSINHTLMSIKTLRDFGFEPVLIYSGNNHQSSEDIIKKMTNTKVITTIPLAKNLNIEFVKNQAKRVEIDCLIND